MLHSTVSKFHLVTDKFRNKQFSPELGQSIRNVTFSGASYVLPIGLWLVTTSLFVSHLGSDQYGIWTLARSFLGISGVMGFGLSDATIKFVSYYRATNDTTAIIRVIRASLTAYLFFGCLTGISLYFAAPLLVHSLFQIKNETLAIAIFQLSSLGIAIRFLDSIFQSIIQGYERYDLTARVSMITNTLTVVSSACIVYLGYGLTAVMVLAIVLQTLSSVAKIIIVKQLFLPQLTITPLLDRSSFKEIFGFSFFSWIQSVGNILLSQLDSFIIASILGTTPLTYYTVCVQITSQIHGLLSSSLSFIFPLSSITKEQGKLTKLRNVYFISMSATTVLVIALTLPFFMFPYSILSLWMGTKFADNSANILRLLSVMAMIKATSIVPYYYMNGTGHVRINTLFGVLSGVFVAIAALLLIPRIGLIGAAFAQFTYMPISIISRTILHYEILKDKRWYSGLIAFLPIVVSLLIAYLFLNSEVEMATEWSRLIVLSIGTSLFGMIIAACTCYFFTMPRQFSA